MDWNQIEGNWKQIKGKIKEQWGHFTDDDLDKIAGRREQLEGKIQERGELDRRVEDFDEEFAAVAKDVDDWLKKQ